MTVFVWAAQTTKRLYDIQYNTMGVELENLDVIVNVHTVLPQIKRKLNT